MQTKTNYLKEIKNPKGNILKIINKKEFFFKGFGEAYLSSIRKGSIKAWKKHKKSHLNLTIILGKVKFVIYNEKKESFKNIILKKNDKKKIYISPGIWFGFMGLSKDNIILSIASEISNEKEILRKKIKEIKYDW
tara:strand:+ start:524 stop:928 length:405 start_codon:yes stop_codon:yes gene_type:complete